LSNEGDPDESEKGDPDALVMKVLRTMLREATKGDAELLELEFVEERPTPAELRFGDKKTLLLVKDEKKHEEEFQTVPISQISSKHKLKFRLKLRHKDYSREVTVVGSAEHKGKTLEHSEKIEIQDLESLPDDTNAPPEGQKERPLKEEKIRQIVTWILSIIEALISLINAIINAKRYF
jgi:hypothetical protein